MIGAIPDPGRTLGLNFVNLLHEVCVVAPEVYQLTHRIDLGLLDPSAQDRLVQVEVTRNALDRSDLLDELDCSPAMSRPG